MSSTAQLLLQLIVILATARICGWVLRFLGQPAVIGEMVAGLLLGPVVFGQLFPQVHADLFPKASLDGLSSLSTLGLVMFMFVVGLETRPQQGIRAQLKAAGCVGVLSVITPLLLGLGISPLLYPDLAPAGVAFWPFALFMAAALSVTAFPVMARILKDRGLTRTRVGQLSLSAAAVVDVFAWILLAVVVELVRASGSYGALLVTVLGVVAMLTCLVLVVRPLFKWLLRTQAPGGEPTPAMLAALVIGLLSASMLTDWLHLHAVFGAFLFGATLPRDEKFVRALGRRFEPFSAVVLMPLFFALAGLGTTPAAFSGGRLGPLLLIVVVATLGKILGGAAGARLAGYRWSESWATGCLMNARGLMELIIMKIGMDAGVIGPGIFTMLLVMALVTTAMTGPLLSLSLRRAPSYPGSTPIAGT
jgi:Kef-type K+ transport system membrane component KefB